MVLVSILQEGCNLSAINGALSKNGKIVMIVADSIISNKEIFVDIYNKVSKNGGCVISCIKPGYYKSSYSINQINEIFICLISKMIVIDAFSSPLFLEVIKLSFEQKRKIAYLTQSHKTQRQYLINEDIELMYPYGATPLSDRQGLEEFLLK